MICFVFRMLIERRVASEVYLSKIDVKSSTLHAIACDASECMSCRGGDWCAKSFLARRGSWTCQGGFVRWVTRSSYGNSMLLSWVAWILRSSSACLNTGRILQRSSDISCILCTLSAVLLASMYCGGEAWALKFFTVSTLCSVRMVSMVSVDSPESGISIRSLLTAERWGVRSIHLSVCRQYRGLIYSLHRLLFTIY